MSIEIVDGPVSTAGVDASGDIFSGVNGVILSLYLDQNNPPEIACRTRTPAADVEN
jgi:hypothetical protein